MNEEKENINLNEINKILSKTLLDLSNKKISLKRAQAISRIALALSKNIVNIELKEKIELLEEIYKKRKFNQ